MFKAVGKTVEGAPILLLGLTFDNLKGLRADKPILFDGTPFGYDGEVMIFAGPTESALVNKIKKPVAVAGSQVTAGMPEKPEAKPKFKPTICLDFDGVIHSGEKGWQDGVIYGELTNGFFEWVMRVRYDFDLVIYSSRSHTASGTFAMAQWFQEQAEIWRKASGNNDGLVGVKIEFVKTKPAAWVTIDARSVCFKGNWMDEELSVEALRGFKAWNQGG